MCPIPPALTATGKTVAIVGRRAKRSFRRRTISALMGHKVTVYEKRAKLGGMLRYGIPSLPSAARDPGRGDRVASSPSALMRTGQCGHRRRDYLRRAARASTTRSILPLGAHTDKKTGIEGEDAEGVHVRGRDAARDRRRSTCPISRGKEIVVIGGGNVAMDVCRSASAPRRA